jgi:ribosomal protein S12 methylthiotransferase
LTESPARAFHIVTLGCSKNRVDSDGMTHLLSQRGMSSTIEPSAADVVIVNTCGFLGAARDESVGVINAMLAQRHDGQIVIAAGCMPALGEYKNAIPVGVDRVLTTREWYRIGDVIGELLGEAALPESAGCEGMLTTFNRSDAGPSAYVKVADGCDHNCHFCTIPSIKGRQVSKRPLHVLQEIVDLVAGGTREVVLVAQDTIRFGADLGMKNGLPSLMQSIAEQIPNLPWLRLLYIYPSPLTLRMVDTMAEYGALLPYLDMPLQHADRDVLRSMNRPSDPDMTRRLIDHARSKLSDLVMRTTFIVGYPGETDAQFQRLLDFVSEMQFDHVGVFTYSPEPGTKAFTLDGAVPHEIAVERRNAVMELQQGISLAKNRAMIGSTLQVLVEAIGESEDHRGQTEPISVGRARRHAPEVDGLVFIPGSLPVGDMVDVQVQDASPYDLWGTVPGLSPVRRLDANRAVRRKIGSRSRGRSMNRPERRGLGRQVPMATPVGTSPIDPERG